MDWDPKAHSSSPLAYLESFCNEAYEVASLLFGALCSSSSPSDSRDIAREYHFEFHIESTCQGHSFQEKISHCKNCKDIGTYDRAREKLVSCELRRATAY